MPFRDDERALATEVVTALLRQGAVIATAESCTGGLIAALITEIPGSSAVFDRGFVTYSNAAKIAMLDVPAAVIDQDGAVSQACALAMAEGALVHSLATIAVAVTGIAGPGGGSPAKPVGLVHSAVAMRGVTPSTQHQELQFGDIGRTGIRSSTTIAALRQVLATLKLSA